MPWRNWGSDGGRCVGGVRKHPVPQGCSATVESPGQLINSHSLSTNGKRDAWRLPWGLPVTGTLGILLSAVIVGFRSKEQALSDLQSLLDQGIRISPWWQAWFRSEVGAAE